MQKLLSFNYLYLLPLSFSAIFSLRAFGLKWPLPFRIFAGFLLCTLMIEAFAIAWKWELHKIAWRVYSPSNLWIYNAFITVRHCAILFLLFHLFKQPAIKKLVLYSFPSFVVFGVLNYFFIQTPHNVNTYTLIVANTETVLLILAFFQQILNDEKIVPLTSSTEMWFALGIFIYYSGTLPLFLFLNYLIHHRPSLATSYFYINDVLNIIMYLFFLIAFSCKPQFLK